MLNSQYFKDLKQLAMTDLSAAHLNQHFTAAKMFAQAGSAMPVSNGTWSAIKPQDTLSYSNYTVTGKKYWISGVPLCNWVVVPAQTPNGHAVVVIDKKHLNIEPVTTMGMEDTLTVHFTCDQAPAEYLYQRNDPLAESADHFNRMAFITIQLGLSIAAFNDIDRYTRPQFEYMKTKAKLDIETFNLIWTYELDRLDEKFDWTRGQLIYSFGKKVILGVAHLVTELTGSGIYEINHSSHQRFKDLLIYTTHMRNTATAIKDITSWSF